MQPTEIIQKLQAFITDLDLVRTDETNEEGRNAALVILESRHIAKGVLRWQIPRTPQTRHAAMVQARDRLSLIDDEAATLIDLLTALHSKAPFSAWPLRTGEPPRQPLPATLHPQRQSLADFLIIESHLAEVWLVSDTPPPRPGQKPGGENIRWWVQIRPQSGDTISLQWSTVLTTLKMRVRGEDQPLANKRWLAWCQAIGTSPDRLDQLMIRLLPFMMLAAPCRVRLS